MKRHLTLILILITQVNLVLSQTQLPEYKKETHRYITARYMYGIVIPHHESMLYFLEAFANSIEINYGFRKFDTNDWSACLNYPEMGVGFYYGTFGNRDIYGEGFALFPYIYYNIIRTRKLSVNNKVSLGLGYATKPFDIDDNNFNLIFSTHLNAYIGLGLNIDYRLSKSFSASISGDLTHMSNGASKKPNHGINVLTGSIGAKYHFNKTDTPILPKHKPIKQNTRELLVVGSYSQSQTTIINAKKYRNASINLNYIWHLNNIRAVGIGIDQFYSESFPHIWEETEVLEDQKLYSTSDYLATGLFASYNVYLGKVNLFTNIGVYIHHKNKPPQSLYPRIGVRYPIYNNLVANFSVKASFFSSEFLEFGLGYRFIHSNNKKSRNEHVN